MGEEVAYRVIRQGGRGPDCERLVYAGPSLEEAEERYRKERLNLRQGAVVLVQGNEVMKLTLGWD